MKPEDILGTNIEADKSVDLFARPTPFRPKTIRIILEENDDIPPTGLFLGLNGKGFMIQAGMEVDIPLALIEILDHAITSLPQVHQQTRRVIGYRQRMRFPYRVIRSRYPEAAEVAA